MKNILSIRSRKTVAADYHKRYGLRPSFLRPDGEKDPPEISGFLRLHVIRQARRHALDEAVRWGEPYIFFLAPGVMSWMVPLVDGYAVRGGITGGEVRVKGEPVASDDALSHLVRHGASHSAALSFLSGLPAWPQSRCREAAQALYELAYQVAGFKPLLLAEHRENAQQQREIAEAIHRDKRRAGRSGSADDEQALLSLIRAGDRRGARRILNQMLGRIFCRTANITILRALVIEMMGHLVRRALESSPYLEPIMEKNHRWMAKIIEADGFESLSAVLREALDDFIDQIYAMGYAAGNPHVRTALTYLAEHFREPVTLEDVATATGLSPFRIAHLVKQETGRSIIEHVHLRRIATAQALLRESRLSCSEIAQEAGYCDQSYFTRQFRKHTGLTPARYRRFS